MRIKIDTTNKIIVVEQATIQELTEFAQKHLEGWDTYNIISENSNTFTYYPYPNDGNQFYTYTSCVSNQQN